MLRVGDEGRPLRAIRQIAELVDANGWSFGRPSRCRRTGARRHQRDVVEADAAALAAEKSAAPQAQPPQTYKGPDGKQHEIVYNQGLALSPGAREELNQAVHGWGGITLHDVIDDRFARKAIKKGADGLIPVAAGAGGHASVKSPFAMVQELREWFGGPIALSGAIASGGAILAAQAMGADLAYIGSAFIATDEARATDGYKEMITQSDSDEIVYSNFYTGVHGNYLKGSIRNAGMDPENLPQSDPSKMNFSSGEEGRAAKAWRDIWGCGQGIGAIHEVTPAADLIARFKREYAEAKARLCAG